MSFAAGGQGTEAQPRRRRCQGILGMRQSKPQETVSVGQRRPVVAVTLRRVTLVALLQLDYYLRAGKACAILCK